MRRRVRCMRRPSCGRQMDAVTRSQLEHDHNSAEHARLEAAARSGDQALFQRVDRADANHSDLAEFTMDRFARSDARADKERDSVDGCIQEEREARFNREQEAGVRVDQLAVDHVAAALETKVAQEAIESRVEQQNS